MYGILVLLCLAAIVLLALKRAGDVMNLYAWQVWVKEVETKFAYLNTVF